MSKSKEKVHLCPICQIVEMEFKERIKSNNYMRMRRFICPICNFEEMYLCGGPNDKEYRERDLDRDKWKKIKEDLDKIRNDR